MADLNVPNALTAAGLASGLLAILAASHGDVPVAVTLILVSLVLDRLDGVAARLLDQSSELGARLDSVADVVSFGVAPAVLADALVEGPAIVVAGVIWAVAAGWRLARFHTDGMVDTRFGRAFVGVPSPGAAAWFLLAATALPPGWRGPGLVLALLLGAVGMLSRVPYLRNGPVLAATVLALGFSLWSVWSG